jgi:3-oxoacyl-[acyl-carrier-protein] synthase II
MKRRVVVTGMAGVTALGNDIDSIFKQMQQQKTAIQIIEEWQDIEGLNTQLGAPIQDFKLPLHFTRKQTRSMGRVAQLATMATEQALIDAKLQGNAELISGGRLGIAYGSCSGSTHSLADLVRIRTERILKNVTATTYIKAMSHTCAVNIALLFEISGRVIPTSSACTSSSQAIGYAYESIRHGYQDRMIAGGAEELCVSQVAVFDTLYATSQKNKQPEITPRPFDKDRDGLVLGEGAVTLILESLDHALARGAPIYAEIVGYGTNCDAAHVTQPSAKTMQTAIELALLDANIKPEQIDYVNLHGTATDRGDIAESHATQAVFGKTILASSLKSYFGHTLGACGALEAWLSIAMMNKGVLFPTINLDAVDPNCATLGYIQSQPIAHDCQYIMSNNFAFGGINTALIFKKWR